MIGLNGSLTRTNFSQAWPVGAVYFADFSNKRFMKNGIEVASTTAFSFSRPSTKLVPDMAGNWHSFAPDMPAITNKGLFLESAETYQPTNANFVGTNVGIVGSGGAIPNGWDASYWSQVEIVSVSSTNGLNTIVFDLTLDNTGGSAAAGRGIEFCRANTELGDYWTVGGFFELMNIFADDTCTAPSNVMQLHERSISDGFLNNYDGLVPDLELSGLEKRQLKTKAITDSNVATMAAYYSWNNVLPGELFHRRCAISLPTATKNQLVSSPLPTSDLVPEIRAADEALLHLPAVAQNLTIQYHDASTSVIEGVSGTTALPLDGEKAIKSVTTMVHKLR